MAPPTRPVTPAAAALAAPAGSFDEAHILVLSSIEWDAAWQRHQIFASQFSAAGHEVFFVENTGFRNPAPRDLSRLWRKLRRSGRGPVGTAGAANVLPRRLRVVNPAVLPPTWSAFRKANRTLCVPRLLRRLAAAGLGPSPIVVAYLPTETTLEILRRLHPSAVVYDCASLFGAHPKAPRDFPALEAELLRRSDLVATDSDFLYARMAPRHPRVIQVHQGVAEEFFSPPPPDGAWRSFCYYGTWGPGLRGDLLAALTEAGFDVTVSGFLKGPPAPPPGVRRLPPVPREGILRRVGAFDAFLMPYGLTPFHQGVVPAKLYECLALGRPVLATPLPSLLPFRDLIYISDSPREWARIARDLPSTETPAKREARIRLAREHTHALEFARLRGALRAAREERGRAGAGTENAAPQTEAAGSLAAGFGWIGGLYALAKAAIVLSTVLAGRWLGPIEYGRANVVIAIAVLLSIAMTLGFPLAISKFVSEEKDPGRRRDLISTAIASFALWAAAVAALLLLAGPSWSARLHVPKELFLWGAAYALLNSIHTVAGSPLLGLTRFPQRGAAEVVYGFSVPMILVVLVLAGHASYKALVLSLVCGFAVGAAYSLWLLRRFLTPTFHPGAFRRIGHYAALGTLGLLSTAFVVGPARLVLHGHFSAREVGVFSAYFNSTAQITLTLGYMINSVLIPLASGSQEQDLSWRRLRRLWPALLLTSWAILLAGGSAGLALFGRHYPFHWPWLAVFSGSAALILLHGTVSALFSARDSRGLRVAAAGWLAAGLGNLGFNLLLTPTWGIAGAGASLCAAYLLGLACYAAFWPKGSANPREAAG